MLEIILAILLCGIMYKIADQEQLSGVAWGGLTMLVCVASVFVPLPYLRVIIAGVAMFVAMIIYKIVARK